MQIEIKIDSSYTEPKYEVIKMKKKCFYAVCQASPLDWHWDI